MSLPENLKYTEEHEWADYDEANGVATIGITDFAQSELGDIVFVELPEVDDEISAGDTIGTIEAVKTVADVYAPLSGTVTEINESLDESPEVINEDPYKTGWIIKIKLSDAAELDKLLSADKYKELID